MIDNFSLGLTHALLLYTVWKLLFRRDLDVEGGDAETPQGWGKRPKNDA